MKHFVFKLIQLLALAASFFVVKKRSLIVVSQSRNRYNGNSRWIFEFLLRDGFDIYWISNSIAQEKKIPIDFRDNVVSCFSLSGLLLILQARVFIISHGFGDFGLFSEVAKRGCAINLWHGVTIKCLGVLDEKLTWHQKSRHLNKESRFYSKIIASSDVDRYITAALHGIDVRKVFVTGLPKTDQYIRAASNKINDPPCEKKMLYAPTFRDYAGARDLFFPFDDFDAKKLNIFFERNPCLKMYLRPHPDDLISNIQAQKLEKDYPQNIIYYSQAICDDIDEVLYQFDAIITDYSSIYLEPLLGDTPCVFVPFDCERYMVTRGLAYDYDMVTPGPKAYTFAQLLQAIEDAQNGASEWAQKRIFVKDMFFKYKDDGACRRIAEQVLGLKLKKTLAKSSCQNERIGA